MATLTFFPWNTIYPLSSLCDASLQRAIGTYVYGDFELVTTTKPYNGGLKYKYMYKCISLCAMRGNLFLY